MGGGRCPYFIWGGSMQLKLYTTNDNENVINKDLELKYTIDIKLKSAVDMVEPEVILNDERTMKFYECNYAQIPDFNRYYFIRSIRIMNNHNWGLSLECDVLESFKDDILNSYVEINRPLKEGEYFTTGTKVESIREIDIYKSDTTLNNEKNIILSTIGGV